MADSEGPPVACYSRTAIRTPTSRVDIQWVSNPNYYYDPDAISRHLDDPVPLSQEQYPMNERTLDLVTTGETRYQYRVMRCLADILHCTGYLAITVSVPHDDIASEWSTIKTNFFQGAPIGNMIRVRSVLHSHSTETIDFPRRYSIQIQVHRVGFRLEREEEERVIAEGGLEAYLDLLDQRELEQNS
ncbi:uncharacterized protein PV06_00812 [Exophiala oligosperma]|uniref:Uncharacterized protein n=1 Tax=Exophiala oligosperma TaxID=215243 RepID=A0A0D2EJW3_9EURO|nr:uncharacterized protein PV06_00812 [Exophiala oligosperma]KIW48199.1 hypothetical protein PV06_00812 [Exophiala oligosperma]